MSEHTTPFRINLSAASLLIAGVFFVLYPALRPFSDETSLQGAAAFGSPRWLMAHMLGVAAGKIGNPVAQFILMESNNCLFNCHH